MSDGGEIAGGLELATRARMHVLNAHARNAVGVVAQDFLDHAVPFEDDLLVGHGAVAHDLAGAELVAPVNDVYAAGEIGEEEGFLHGRVSAAHDHDGFAAETGERAVAGRAGGNAPVHETFFGFQAEILRRGAGSDDHAFGLPGFIARGDRKRPAGEIHRRDRPGKHLRAEPFGLFLEQLHHFGSGHAVGEPGEILDFGCGHELPAGQDLLAELALEHERREIRASRVERRRIRRRTRPDDDNSFHASDSIAAAGGE